MQNNNTPKPITCQYGSIYSEDVSRLKGASGSECLVFMVLCIHAYNGQRVAFPSTTTIQNITDLSRASVLRALKGLRTRGAIVNVGKTPTGVNKYHIPTGIKSDTGINTETSVQSDTGINNATPTSSTFDTQGVADLQPIKLKESRSNKLLLASYKGKHTREDELFVLLWNKWYASPLCLWESTDPLADFKTMKMQVVRSWQKQGLKKDLYYELQVCDIYLMQSKVSICGNNPYKGMARLWAGEKWRQGLHKWLSSTTPSHMGGNRKSFIKYVISVEPKQTEPKHTDYGNTQEDVADSEGLPPTNTAKQNNGRSTWLCRAIVDMLEAYDLHGELKYLQEAWDALLASIPQTDRQSYLQDEQCKASIQQLKNNGVQI